MGTLRRVTHRIVLRPEDRAQITSVALRNPTLEVAGFVIGRYRGRTVWIDEVVFGEKEGWRERSFRLEARPSIVRKLADPSTAVGIFHAHPGGRLLPSFWDIRGMMATRIPWLILKVEGERMLARGYVYEDGLVKRLRIQSA